MRPLKQAQQRYILNRWRSRPSASVYFKAAHRGSFCRRLATDTQVQTAKLQPTRQTPLDGVAEIPHVKAPPPIFDVPSPLWYHRVGPVKDFFAWLSRSQRSRPLTIAVATSLTTYLCGDIIAQEIGREAYDGKRTLRMLLIGALASIPGYKWFLFLGTHFNYGSTAMNITIKVLIQQFFFAPVFNTYFFSMQAVLAGASTKEVVERIKAAVPESVISSAKFWPAVTALNFTLIPAHLRFAFSGVFAVVWQTYLSFLNRKEERIEPMGSLAKEATEAVKGRIDGIVDAVASDD